MEKEIGGNHYSKQPYQPIRLISELNLNFFQGNIVKYITRCRYKNGKEDLEKALHYAELGMELNPSNNASFRHDSIERIHQYCLENNLPRCIPNIFIYTLYQDWENARHYISLFIETYE